MWFQQFSELDRISHCADVVGQSVPGCLWLLYGLEPNKMTTTMMMMMIPCRGRWAQYRWITLVRVDRGKFRPRACNRCYAAAHTYHSKLCKESFTDATLDTTELNHGLQYRGGGTFRMPPLFTGLRLFVYLVRRVTGHQSNIQSNANKRAEVFLFAHIFYNITYTNCSTSVNSEWKLQRTSWSSQCLSRRLLKVLSVSASTTKSGKLFHIINTKLGYRLWHVDELEN